MLKENLIALRRLSGDSQEKIAEIAGVSRQAYAKWEKGEALPDIERCMALAEYYGVSLDSLCSPPKEFLGKPLMPAPRGKHIWGMVTVNDRGQIVIPRQARELFGLNSGSRLVVLGDEGEGIALVKAEDFEERIQNIHRFAENDAAIND